MGWSDGRKEYAPERFTHAESKLILVGRSPGPSIR
jgi:hypothetical protein